MGHGTRTANTLSAPDSRLFCQNDFEWMTPLVGPLPRELNGLARLSCKSLCYWLHMIGSATRAGNRILARRACRALLPV